MGDGEEVLELAALNVTRVVAAELLVRWRIHVEKRWPCPLDVLLPVFAFCAEFAQKHVGGYISLTIFGLQPM